MHMISLQAKLQEATRQLSGGAADAPSYAQLKKQLAAAEEQLTAAAAKEQQLSTQVLTFFRSCSGCIADKLCMSFCCR